MERNLATSSKVTYAVALWTTYPTYKNLYQGHIGESMKGCVCKAISWSTIYISKELDENQKPINRGLVK